MNWTPDDDRTDGERTQTGCVVSRRRRRHQHLNDHHRGSTRAIATTRTGKAEEVHRLGRVAAQELTVDESRATRDVRDSEYSICRRSGAGG